MNGEANLPERHMNFDPLDASADPFKPPAIPTGVACLHCGREYESYLIEWRMGTAADGSTSGFWCCPTPGCDGKGFGFDIFPVDPEYRDERGGWVRDDDGDGADDDLGDSDLDDGGDAGNPPADRGA
jgi:hypothetical protein